MRTRLLIAIGVVLTIVAVGILVPAQVLAQAVSVKAGTIVTFVNSGMMTHTVSAHGASWSTGPLKLAESGYVRFDELGVYTYHCEDHPCVMGQITVVP